MSVNKVILVGNVGNDPEVKYLEGGTPVAKFSLATSESYKNKAGDRVSSTEWLNIIAWRGLAEVIEKYVTKGKQLYVEGKITTRSWEDKDGVKRYTTEIVANTIQMLGRKDDNGSVVTPESEGDPAGPQVDNSSDVEDGEQDDLPF